MTWYYLVIRTGLVACVEGVGLVEHTDPLENYCVKWNGHYELKGLE